MPTVGVNQLNRGNAVRLDGEIYLCVNLEHVKPGKGPAYVQAKLKHARSGKVVDRRLRAAENVEQIDVDRAEATFSYSRANTYVFMHTETFEEIDVPADLIADKASYLVEGEPATICTVGSQVLSVDLPKTIVLEVVQTPPGIKNASATNVGKPATTNTGLVVSVPPFINQGDRIKVDTDTGAYIERVNA